MSTCSELSRAEGLLLDIDSESAPACLADFAHACFRSGRFRSPAGGEHRWLLDCRAGLGRGEYLPQLAGALAALAAPEGIRQFAGIGYGSHLLLGAMLTLRADYRAGLLREAPKTHGRGLWIEGALEPAEPVAIVDDVLNSGRTALAAQQLLQRQGYRAPLHLCLFRFAWGRGEVRLRPVMVESRALAVVRQLPGRVDNVREIPAPQSPRTRWLRWKRNR